MGKSWNGRIATGICCVSFLLILIASSTPNWLETDGQLERTKFSKLGLWTVCFSNFQDPRFWYDVDYTKCFWVFEEEYYIIFDLILPNFFAAVQFCFTLCLIFNVFAVICLLYLGWEWTSPKLIRILVCLGVFLILAGLCGTIAVYLFGLYGDGRDWMPDWQHNHIGWSYAVGVVGVITSYASGILFLIQAKRIKTKRNQDKHGGYHIQPKKSTQSVF